MCIKKCLPGSGLSSCFARCMQDELLETERALNKNKAEQQKLFSAALNAEGCYSQT